MYIIKIKSSFDSAHFLSEHNGKCANIHGHHWEVEVEIQAQKTLTSGSSSGMVMDFAIAKMDLNEIIDIYDHGLIVENGSLKEDTYNCLVRDGFKVIIVEYRPTSENMANYIYKYLSKHGYEVRSVTVQETPKNSATYGDF